MKARRQKTYELNLFLGEYKNFFKEEVFGGLSGRL